MSVSLKASEAVQIRDIFVLYSKKSGFNIEEYVDVGSVWKRINDIVTNAKSTDANVSLTNKDAVFIYNTLNVCSTRSPVEAQNYKPIGAIFELVTELVKDLQLNSSDDDVEEVKED
jgi:hypothetical protein